MNVIEKDVSTGNLTLPFPTNSPVQPTLPRNDGDPSTICRRFADDPPTYLNPKSLTLCSGAELHIFLVFLEFGIIFYGPFCAQMQHGTSPCTAAARFSAFSWSFTPSIAYSCTPVCSYPSSKSAIFFQSYFHPCLPAIVWLTFSPSFPIITCLPLPTLS